MTAKPTHPRHHEQLRLEALRACGILDTPSEPIFDLLVEAAAEAYSTSFALLSFVDEGRQFFKAAHGLSLRETCIEASFCFHAIKSGEVLVVPDATLDPRFHDTPLVTGEPFLRFYAGAPVVTESGFRLGTVCVLDPVPRPAESVDPSALAHFALWARELLEHRQSGSGEPLELSALRTP